MNTDTIPTEAGVITELANLAAAKPQPLDPAVLTYVVVPDGATGEVLDLTKYLDAPRRKTGVTRIIDAESFVMHVNDHKTGSTRLYAVPDQGTVTAVFDDHSATDPGWGQHRVILQVKKTREWLHWETADGKLGKQTEFANHIEDGLLEIREPDGATMLELAQSFQAHTNVTFRTSDRLANGERQFTYDEEVTAAAGRTGNLAVPEQFVLGIAPYEGTDPYRVEARLRWRLSNGQLSIGYKLTRPADVLRVAFDEILSAIATETQLGAMLGTPADSR
jgi:uncharacterized protein YfdQ (DUF2303 family)